ncbi:hypothetical protein D3C81_1311350 [compost metagenome]
MVNPAILVRTRGNHEITAVKLARLLLVKLGIRLQLGDILRRFPLQEDRVSLRIINVDPPAALFS